MLGQDAVDVWWVRLADAADARADLLTPAERERFDRYVRDEDRWRFAAGSAVVRLATSGYVGTNAHDIPLDRSCPDCGRPHGRVRLPAAYGLEVSVTHSGEWVGVAFARRPVGLDVERTRPRDDLDGIARLALDPAEAEILAGLPERSRPAAFTRYWARKEAVLKATGEGLRTPPAQVAVSAPDDAPRLLAHAGRPGLA
ncbi:4'-phosphopantetheinyl transferase family protein, partial [Luedemannella flava]|uniref:4'-phosphopantetheinyl transferase family protein n=1 Tax=Luedemannella flava TaxID=349316 RepID=UPI0031D652CB